LGIRISASRRQQGNATSTDLAERLSGFAVSHRSICRNVCLAARLNASMPHRPHRLPGHRFTRRFALRVRTVGDVSQSGLAEYDRRRQQAADFDGRCRLSAYLHYGMIARFAIASGSNRGTATELPTGSAGGESFLDEFLVWREMSFFTFAPASTKQTRIARRVVLNGRSNHCGNTRRFREVRTKFGRTPRSGQNSRTLGTSAQRVLLRQRRNWHKRFADEWGKAFFLKMAESARANHCVYLIDLIIATHSNDAAHRATADASWCFGQFRRALFENKTPVNAWYVSRTVENTNKRLPVTRFSSAGDVRCAATLPRVAVNWRGQSAV